jgi:hypothetical protein
VREQARGGVACGGLVAEEDVGCLVEYEGGWLRVIEDVTAEELDRIAEANAITAALPAERRIGEQGRADGG